MNQRVELATPLYARSNTGAGMSSIRTMDCGALGPGADAGPRGPAMDSGPGAPAPSADRDTSSRPPAAARAAARSASFSAAQTQSTSARPATADSPATTPPPPRRLVSLPSLPRLKDTGPRLDAISTRPGSSALMEGEVRASVPGALDRVAAPRRPIMRLPRRLKL